MITVFGSINLDLIVAVDALPRPGETVLGPEYRMLAGGKGANQALAAARAGARVRLIGAVGDDDFAERALADLRGAAVDLSGVVRKADPTGAALICVDRRGENMIVVASGANRRVTATGPAPGPPPPCGVANVLCVFMCTMSNPMSPGRARPMMAFRFAPS